MTKKELNKLNNICIKKNKSMIYYTIKHALSDPIKRKKLLKIELPALVTSNDSEKEQQNKEQNMPGCFR